jgi:hypothetical protein
MQLKPASQPPVHGAPRPGSLAQVPRNEAEKSHPSDSAHSTSELQGDPSPPRGRQTSTKSLRHSDPDGQTSSPPGAHVLGLDAWHVPSTHP